MSNKKSKKKIKAGVVSIVMLIIASLGLYGCDLLNIINYDDILSVFKPTSSTPITDAEFSVNYIDVGQGDSILICNGDKNVLIDAGEKKYSETVIDYIESKGVTKLDFVIGTHPHADHIGGLAEVIESFDVGEVIVPRIKDSMVPTTVTYEKLLDAVANKGLKLTPAVPNDTYELDGATMKIQGPVGDDYDNLNDYSVVLTITHGDNSFMFTGDTEKAAEYVMLDNNLIDDIDVLKVAHHGSSSSSSEKFLAATKPEYCVIMCGVDNSYNHPNDATVKRLSKYTDKIYRTDLLGSITIESDGKDLNIMYEEN